MKVCQAEKCEKRRRGSGGGKGNLRQGTCKSELEEEELRGVAWANFGDCFTVSVSGRKLAEWTGDRGNAKQGT